MVAAQYSMLVSLGVLRSIVAIQDLPFVMFAWMEGLAVKTWIAETTGLSKALVYRGGLDTLRPSTQAGVRKHARQRGLDKALKYGWSEQEFLENEQRLQAVEAQKGGGWALFVASSDNPLSPVLDRSVALAVRFDHDLEVLRQAAASCDIDAYRTAGALLASTHAQLGTLGADTEVWGSAATWQELELPTKQLLEAYWLEVHACLDAEWGSEHFPSMSPTPLFPFLWPTADTELAERGMPWADFKKNLHRPTRRFLQFIYAMFYRRKYGQWPIRPPGATKIAEAWGLDAKAVSKYFDATHLRASTAESAWDQMSIHFLGVVVAGYPALMARLAICWQNTLLEMSGSKLTGVIFLDKVAYQSAWCRHHAGLFNAKPGEDPWPTWLAS